MAVLKITQAKIFFDPNYQNVRILSVMLLPSIEPSMVPAGVKPLLVFVNVKSGGCQGLELISSFRKLLNPYQVFDLENGGPLPGWDFNITIKLSLFTYESSYHWITWSY